MKTFWCLLAVCVPGMVTASVPLDELFAGWEKARASAQSLVVEFTLEQRDRAFDQRETYAGTFRFLRTRAGEVFASYQAKVRGPAVGQPKPLDGLLSGGRVYLLNKATKTALRFEPAGGDIPTFLERYFNPLVVLLDRRRAESRCMLEVVKQDDWYTYLVVTPRQELRGEAFANNFLQGRAVLMRRGSEAIPRGMPRQLWLAGGVFESRIDIQSWRLNPAGGPQPGEFTRPEDRPGWVVSDWPFQGKRP